MADRISALEAEKASIEALVPIAAKPKSADKKQPPPPPDDDDTSSSSAAALQLKQDFAEALRSKGVSETRLRAAQDELAKLRAKSKSDSKSIRDLAADRSTLTTRLKDRDYELREKRKLIEVRNRPHTRTPRGTGGQLTNDENSKSRTK